MNNYVAFLRGINVGGNKKVAMSQLRSICENLGWNNVQTYINSGNVIFESQSGKTDTLAADLEKSLENELGFDVQVIVRTADNIRKLAQTIPSHWTNDAENKTDVIFLSDSVDSPDVIQSIQHKPEVDHLQYVDGAVIWHLKRDNYNKSGMKLFIGTHVYRNMTARNVNTVRKLADMLST